MEKLTQSLMGGGGVMRDLAVGSRLCIYSHQWLDPTVKRATINAKCGDHSSLRSRSSYYNNDSPADERKH